MKHVTFDQLNTVERAFAFEGESLHTSPGRETLCLLVGDEPHLLKRFWWTPALLLHNPANRALHELRVVHWMHTHGFRGPQVVAKGRRRVGGLVTRVYFVIRENRNELPLSRYCEAYPDRVDSVIEALAGHLAHLHGLGFSHPTATADDLLVSDDAKPIFRHIDLAGARVGVPHAARSGADLRGIVESLPTHTLQHRCAVRLLPHYLQAARRGLDTLALRRAFDRGGRFLAST